MADGDATQDGDGGRISPRGWRPPAGFLTGRFSYLRAPELFAIVAAVLAVAALVTHNRADGAPHQLLNVSYDPTREVYAALDKTFAEQYRAQTGTALDIKQSHGGSGRQARDVASGNQRAAVVSLALPSDIDTIAEHGQIDSDWRTRLPDNSSPYTSTVVFVVRKGNPRGIRDWADLVKPGVSVVTPDPRSSGSGQLAFLAAWGSVTTRGGSPAQAKDYISELYQHVTAFDSGARTSSVSFATLGLGDVQLAWESEGIREVKDDKTAGLQVVYPPVSILAIPSVARVDANTKDPKQAAAADAYLKYLFTDQAQETFAEYGYRPVNPTILAKHVDTLPTLSLFPITAVARDWLDAREKFFGSDGTVTNIIASGPAKPIGVDALTLKGQ